ncbi:MAG: NAD-dependent deacylase [Chloroflexota bacterium]
MTQRNSHIINLFRQAKHIAVLTGAGVSAESGIPTFREAQTGLWAQYDPEALATPQAFEANPKLVWDWYQWRAELVGKAMPNPGHFALAELESLVPTLTLITQNVDGLHAQAGSQNIIELHGRINRYKCSAEHRIVTHWESTETPPRCPHCSAYLRPDVVWFGEGLPRTAIEEAFEAAEQCDLFLSIGTSSLVQPAASLPLIALEKNTAVIEINPNPTPLSRYVTHTLSYPAGEILPTLIDQLQNEV